MTPSFLAKFTLSLASALLAGIAVAPLRAQEGPRPGYTDTPRLPGQPWRVHDRDRPRPPVVEPAPGAGLGTEPPADAVLLFSGDSLDAWSGGSWKLVEGNAMEVTPTGDLRSKEGFGDCQLHVEWRTPKEVHGEGQERGNSGVFLMGLYEVQILDSWKNPTYADGQAGAIYGQWPPLVNACRPPGEWQAFDIVFRAPRFSPEGELLVPAVMTVFQNGILIQDHRVLLGPTVHRALPAYRAHPAALPLVLQDHGNPLRYRNIWIRRLS